eukprot:6885051-Pyramimonas_sp.AAC.1
MPRPSDCCSTCRERSTSTAAPSGRETMRASDQEAVANVTDHNILDDSPRRSCSRDHQHVEARGRDAKASQNSAQQLVKTPAQQLRKPTPGLRWSVREANPTSTTRRKAGDGRIRASGRNCARSSL